MKRRPAGKRTKPIIHLIAEDTTGIFVFKEILRKKRINAQVITYGNAEGVSRLAKEIDELITIALRQWAQKDCIVVLHDSDDAVQTYRDEYERIANACKRFETQVARLEAQQEIEAWLLADDGFCHWLGIKAKASDHIQQPSQKLDRMINDKFQRRYWTNANKPKILEQHMDASGDLPGRSASMRIAVDTLLQLPCAQQANPA